MSIYIISDGRNDPASTNEVRIGRWKDDQSRVIAKMTPHLPKVSVHLFIAHDNSAEIENLTCETNPRSKRRSYGVVFMFTGSCDDRY